MNPTICLVMIVKDEAPRLARCDVEGLCAALDTTDPATLDFHARHGFEVVDEFELPGGGPRVWVLLREPRMEPAGIEPATSGLQSPRSPN